MAVIMGTSAADTLNGGGDADSIDGGGGEDIASYAGSAAVSVTLGGTVSGGDAAGDTLTGIEHLIGSGQADTLTGDGNANHLKGEGGNDSLAGGTGFDYASYEGSAAAVSVVLGGAGCRFGRGRRQRRMAGTGDTSCEGGRGAASSIRGSYTWVGAMGSASRAATPDRLRAPDRCQVYGKDCVQKVNYELSES